MVIFTNQNLKNIRKWSKRMFDNEFTICLLKLEKIILNEGIEILLCRKCDNLKDYIRLRDFSLNKDNTINERTELTKQKICEITELYRQQLEGI